MRHFSCDACGKALPEDAGERFVVRVEGYPAADAGDLADAGLDVDHVADMAELLAELEECDEEPSPTGMSHEYDLCPGCYRRFHADPLGRDRRRVRFSPN